MQTFSPCDIKTPSGLSLDAVLDLPHRPRRLRQKAAVRALVAETFLRAEDFVQPFFIIEGNGPNEAVPSMPGVDRLTINTLLQECEACLKLGIRSIVIFPKLDVSLKSPLAEEALNPDTLVLRAVREVKKNFPELLLMTDIALDPYTVHGHDGILNAMGADVDNDPSVHLLTQMALNHAEAGVDFVAPSDMMDGRIGSIRSGLDRAGFTTTGIMAYAAKYNSAYYGPFRDAVGSAKAAGTNNLDKRTYQISPENRRQALIEASLDEAEGADMLMVKPAGIYLDIIRELRDRTELPIAAYQVSGEYAQIHAAASLGWLDYEKARDESLIAIKRAGADIIFSYFAKQFAQQLSKK
ncbi:MAG: porphobilinogen synthase [Verrucomicrobia bacterium CG_4_10_14_3_um_filter_43_23]|nr:MAG: delta-aminolevulinic acid dehydratase [Verrucomicrobia bacterium CG1_02_43_26]PIP59030.1 MAG: porphobilinogen synthase [Verrucomicrobia bacterium CG22_combo_CG10-13_8_21_14_all_43_17]PIX59127.1 MAG: porphobilinogen synthase [Verrucomicrobia bacterium CG_4_10_14_3_um_filter_43_23]PIY61351.1 MAG: porphobilinogen synthase [Verrucomicrobia bacterium CG_4_10_14_0_8_um_filter_43_34]PJA44132.1 MAG: porphobilinogen synthase [Verrucomicrobia bacterium CG_4_9_14_3_um_filter_43_20]